MIRNLLERIPGMKSDGMEKSVPELLLALCTLPFRFLFHFVAFLLTYWAASRSLPAFVRGLPAILFAGGFVSAIIVASFLLETRLVGNYEARLGLEMSKDVDDQEMSVEYAEKLISLLPEEDRYRYQLGLARYQTGDELGGIDVMRYLAEKNNNPSAQVWLARITSSVKNTEMTQEEKVKESIKYYNLAIPNLDPEVDRRDFIEAHMGLALAYENESKVAPTEAARTQALTKAIEKLKIITDAEIILLMQLEAIPRLIQYYVDSGQRDQAQMQLRRSMARIRELAIRNPGQINIWLAMVRSCAIVNDFDYAESVIEEGMKLAPSRDMKLQILRLKSEVLLQRAKSMTNTDTEGRYKLRLQAISQSLIANPQSPEGFRLLLEYVLPENETPQQEKWLRQSVIGTPTPAVSHIVLGLRALNQGEILEGQRHWQIASRQTAEAYQIINSLIAYCHARAPEKFTNLNDIISVAIESFPSEFIFYVTRGRMYSADKQYQKAVDDFEVAVRKLPNVIVLREAMVEAYEGLGNSEKAAENQAEVDRMREELEVQRMKLLEENQ